MSEHWDRLSELFHAAIALPAADRARFLADRCGENAALRAEVERLVASHERAGDFIAHSAVASADGSMAGESRPPVVGRRLGPYRVVREIAHGGMGAVYLAERADGQYEQRAAIKLIKRGMDSDLILRRFRAERQILASLDHPNIARILDGGTTDDGQPYFVMEYIDGQSIDRFANSQQLSIAERLRLFLLVSGAVAYAHRQLVVHRDIKPANILVTAQGVPKLLDFGIARVVEPNADEPAPSVTGLRLLTPEYASPEQVDGRRATPQSDVYSLGVVLYELLTGRSPYGLESRDPLVVAEAVRTTSPVRPSAAVDNGADENGQLRRSLKGDIDTIVLTALQKEPARRYQSVDALAEDVQRHLDGLPVRARPDSIGYRGSKYLRRNRSAVLAATAAGLAVVLVTGMLAVVSRRSDRNADRSRLADAPLAARDRVLLADFRDHTGDPGLAAAIGEAFRVDLTESPLVQVLSPRQVSSALARLQRPPDLTLDDTLAREVAVREGVKAIVTGSVSKLGGRYTMSAQLIGAENGELLAAAREVAADSNDLIRCVDRLSESLRRRMGESLRSIQARPPLEQVTTGSLAALRAYSEAIRAFNTAERDRGIQLLRRAVALDTGFASAFRLLATNYGDRGDVNRMETAMEHALANQTRLPFYERSHVIASQASAIRVDYDAALDAYRRILARYPDDVRALNNVSFVYGLRRQYAAQETVLVHAVAVDSTIPTVQAGIVTARMNRGDFAGARRALDTLEARFPDGWNGRLSEIYLAAAQQDWAEAERRSRARLAASTPFDSLDGLESLAGIVMTQGRLGEAERHSRRVLAMSGRLNSWASYLSSALRLGYLDLRFRHAPTSALRTVEEAITRFPKDSAPDVIPYDDLARFFAAAGRPARGRELIAEAERSRLGRLRGVQPDRYWSLGTIAMAEGRVSDAVRDLRQAADTHECPICVLPDLARAYESARQPDSALAVYERYFTLPWKWRFETDAVELGRSLGRAAELYAQRGDSVRASAARSRLLALWRQADPELDPVRADVRRLGARLQ